MVNQLEIGETPIESSLKRDWMSGNILQKLSKFVGFPGWKALI